MKIWSYFCFKIVQNLIKNRSKNNIEFKVGLGIDIFWIFNRFLTNFGPILAPKWPAFSERIWVWKRSRLQSELQRPSGPHLGPFWDRFGSILGPFLTIFLSNLIKNYNKFPIKAMFVQVYLHTSVVLILHTPVPIDAVRFRGRRNGVSLLDNRGAATASVQWWCRKRM